MALQSLVKKVTGIGLKGLNSSFGNYLTLQNKKGRSSASTQGAAGLVIVKSSENFCIYLKMYWWKSENCMET